MKILVTGGCGFIGGAIIRRLLGDGHEVVNLDKLTYAAVPQALAGMADLPGYTFVKGDICDPALVGLIFERHATDAIIHCAAESHVDRSIDGPGTFLHTNITGTFTLLEAARAFWEGRDGTFRFLHVSTDEVFGSLSLKAPAFIESSPYAPNSPYSASKAASDHLVRAWGETYGLPVLTTHCSNNYGPWQFPEKLIPLMAINGIEGRMMPIYGSGLNVRDWVHVDDHADAVIRVLEGGRCGETYNIGGKSERQNIDVVRQICRALDSRLPASVPRERLIRHVPDRAGHDRRYAVNTAKIKRELDWVPSRDFEGGLDETIAWYLDNRTWWEEIRAQRYAGQRLGRGLAPEPMGALTAVE